MADSPIYPSSLQGFLAKMRGPVRASRYEIYFSGYRQAMAANERLSYACENVTLPGKTIASVPFRIYGPKNEVPYETLYDNQIPMSFRVSDDYFERLVFEDWMDRTVKSFNGDTRFSVEYLSDLMVRILDTDDNPVAEITMTGVYPKMLGEMEMAYSASDRYLVQPIVFAYTEYRHTGFFKPPGLL